MTEGMLDYVLWQPTSWTVSMRCMWHMMAESCYTEWLEKIQEIEQSFLHDMPKLIRYLSSRKSTISYDGVRLFQLFRLVASTVPCTFDAGTGLASRSAVNNDRPHSIASAILDL